MAEYRQKLRGSTAELDQVIGNEGLLTYDSTRKEMRAFDGVLQGGYRIPNLATIDTLYKLPERLTATGKSLDATSANTAQEPGFYLCTATTTDTPADGEVATLLVEVSGVVFVQTWTLDDNSARYRRTYTGTWSAWLRELDIASVAADVGVTAYNAERLNGQIASYYTNIVARLGYTPVNKAGDTMTSLILTTPLAASSGGTGMNTPIVPAGTVIQFAGAAAPDGYLAADGAVVSRATYAALFAAIGTVYGVGDGATTFGLPDLRGEFVRGLDGGRGVDPGRTLGSAQAANIASHLHTVDPPVTVTTQDTHNHTVTSFGSTSVAGNHAHTLRVGTTGGSGDQAQGVSNLTTSVNAVNAAGDHVHSVTVSGTTSQDTHDHTVDIAEFNSGSTGTGTDTRPRNVALLYCIKT